MMTKRSSSCFTNTTEENLSVPPGFVSLTSFTLKRKLTGREEDNLTAENGKSRLGLVDAPLRNVDIKKFKASFRQRPWIRYDQFDHVPEKRDSDPDEVSVASSLPQKDPLSACLPEGVIWGCANCGDCVKVSARWQPNESCSPALSDAPVFHPTEEEFKDTLEYIAKIRPKAEKFGICSIVPPPSWRPPCLLEDTKTWEGSKFTAHFQKIDGLQNLYMEAKSADVGAEFEKGPEFTLKSFKKCADDFKAQYFCMCAEGIENKDQRGPLAARIEGEYWRITEKPNAEVKVLCGPSLRSPTLGSGFPTSTNAAKYMAKFDKYVESGWNLNNIPNLPGCLLPFGCYKGSAFSVSIPQLFIGMCFASQFWRTEDHHLYSISYLHLGEPKVCYGTSGRYCFKFVEVVKKLYPRLAKYPKLLHELVPQLPPSTLVAEGIPVYRCVQNPREFVVTFPGAYHTEFSCGFNCSETVCFAPLDWLPHGQNIVEIYAENCFKASISHDKLLIGAAMAAVTAQWESFLLINKSVENQMWISGIGKNGILTRAVKSRGREEGIRREHLCNLTQSSTLDSLNTPGKLECTICLYDLYFSAVNCSCCPTKYACLRHSKQLCSCPWASKRFFFRYELTELGLLIEALEGNLKAMHSWAKRKAQPDSAR